MHYVKHKGAFASGGSCDYEVKIVRAHARRRRASLATSGRPRHYTNGQTAGHLLRAKGFRMKGEPTFADLHQRSPLSPAFHPSVRDQCFNCHLHLEEQSRENIVLRHVRQ
jgi:hypothetical protein